MSGPSRPMAPRVESRQVSGSHIDLSISSDVGANPETCKQVSARVRTGGGDGLSVQEIVPKLWQMIRRPGLSWRCHFRYKISLVCLATTQLTFCHIVADTSGSGAAEPFSSVAIAIVVAVGVEEQQRDGKKKKKKKKKKKNHHHQQQQPPPPPPTTTTTTTTTTTCESSRPWLC